MLIALLAVLGVDLIVVVVLLAGVLARKRWIKHQPDAFRGAIRVVSGELDGFGTKWRRGYGRWVRDVLVWTKAPLLLWNEILPADGVEGESTERPEGIKRLGDSPLLATVTSGGATLEIAAPAESRVRLLGPRSESGRD